MDARIRNGLDAAGNPIPNWTEPVFRQWENKTARDALDEFLAGYKLVLVAQPGTKKFLVTYPEAAPKPEAGPPETGDPLDRVLEMLSLDESVPKPSARWLAKAK